MSPEERAQYPAIRVGQLVLPVIAAAFAVLAAYKASLGYLVLTGVAVLGLVILFALGDAVVKGKLAFNRQLHVLVWAAVVLAIIAGALGIFVGFRPYLFPKSEAGPGPAGPGPGSGASGRAGSGARPNEPVARGSGFAERASFPQPQPQAPFTCKPDMVPVPGRTFAMGAGQNAKQVTVRDYCIDRTEVTVAAYYACVASGACSAGAGTARWTEYKTDAEAEADTALCNRANEARQADHPMNCISWDQARAYCEAKGDRLPTEAEWEYAARGPEGREYPWDGPEDPFRLNACGAECTNKRHLHDRDDGYPRTAPVGSFPLGKSYFGALDMAGNVWEWTADWYDAYQKGRVDRGGSWESDLWLSVKTTRRSWDEPDLQSPRVGFRCASDAPR